MFSAGHQKVCAEVKGTHYVVKQAIHLALWQRPFWNDRGVDVVQLPVHIFTQFLLACCPALPSLLSARARTNTLSQEAPLSYMTFLHLFQPSAFWAASFLPDQSWAQIRLQDMSARERGKGIKRAVKNNREKKGDRRRQRETQRDGGGRSSNRENMKFN